MSTMDEAIEELLARPLSPTVEKRYNNIDDISCPSVKQSPASEPSFDILSKEDLLAGSLSPTAKRYANIDELPTPPIKPSAASGPSFDNLWQLSFKKERVSNAEKQSRTSSPGSVVTVVRYDSKKPVTQVPKGPAPHDAPSRSSSDEDSLSNVPRAPEESVSNAGKQRRTSSPSSVITVVRYDSKKPETQAQKAPAAHDSAPSKSSSDEDGLSNVSCSPEESVSNAGKPRRTSSPSSVVTVVRYDSKKPETQVPKEPAAHAAPSRSSSDQNGLSNAARAPAIRAMTVATTPFLDSRRGHTGYHPISHDFPDGKDQVIYQEVDESEIETVKALVRPGRSGTICLAAGPAKDKTKVVSGQEISEHGRNPSIDLALIAGSFPESRPPSPPLVAKTESVSGSPKVVRFQLPEDHIDSDSSSDLAEANGANEEDVDRQKERREKLRDSLLFLLWVVKSALMLLFDYFICGGFLVQTIILLLLAVVIAMMKNSIAWALSFVR